MKLQQNEVAGYKLPKLGLSTCVLGLVLCPLAYISIGALTGFAPAFSFLTLPPLLASTSYLLFRFLSKLGRGSSSKLLVTVEIVSWILTIAFLIVVSNFTLLSEFERIGLFCTLFLLSTLVSLPIALICQTALEERLRQLPNTVAILLLLVVLLIAVVIATVYLLRMPTFP
ncbi:MAG: hypothetical protein NTV43_06435 [Methylococcales bacterium]|nr:hypothetical protein [Methylococcales bacterium]